MFEVVVTLKEDLGDGEVFEWEDSPVPIAFKVLPRVGDVISLNVNHDPVFHGERKKRATSTYVQFTVSKVVHEIDESGLTIYLDTFAIKTQSFAGWHPAAKQPWVCRLYPMER